METDEKVRTASDAAFEDNREPPMPQREMVVALEGIWQEVRDVKLLLMKQVNRI